MTMPNEDIVPLIYFVPAQKRLNPYRKVGLDRNYLLGLKPPNYPVPATLGCVSLGQDYEGIVFINHANGDDWTYAYDQHHQHVLL